MSFLSNLFKRKPNPCPCPPPTSTNPLDLGNGFSVSSVDDFLIKRATFVIPLGGFYSFTYNGVEVYRIDQDGGRNI